MAILVTVLMFVVSTLLALIAWVFLDFRKTITHQMKTNGRHLDSIISTLWTLMLRMDSVETFLDETTEYRPIRMPIPPSHEGENRG